jgi:uncharacterized protein
MVAAWNGGCIERLPSPRRFGNEQRSRVKNVKSKLQCAITIGFLALLAMPLPAGASGILGPIILHPVRRSISATQIAQADQSFARDSATREDFCVTALDGIVLRGWKVRPAHPSGDWVVLFHGRSQNRLAMMSYATFLLSSGYNVVMMDARAHGESGGTIATYGYLERYDSRAILDALTASEHVSHAFALGESMGAAVALQSAAMDPRIQAVVAEGAFRNLHEVMFDYAGLRVSALLGKTLFRPAAIMAVHEAEQQGGFRFDDVSPEESVAVRKFPVLLISGLSDHNIPRRHAEAIFLAASGPKELWLVPGARHQKAFQTEPAEFQRRVLKIFSSACTVH